MDVHQATISVVVMDDQGKLPCNALSRRKGSRFWSLSKGYVEVYR
jgi:hypothetical protein